MSGLPLEAAEKRTSQYRRSGPCVDGSGLARRIFTLQHWSEQPCVRPVLRGSHDRWPKGEQMDLTSLHVFLEFLGATFGLASVRPDRLLRSKAEALWKSKTTSANARAVVDDNR